MGKSARAACKREVRASRLHALNETDDDRAKFDAKQAAMARAMAAPKVPVVNSRAHQNMTMETDDANDARRSRDVVVDAETLARAEDAARRNDEAVAWGMNAVGKADIFLKTKEGRRRDEEGTKAGRRADSATAGGADVSKRFEGAKEDEETAETSQVGAVEGTGVMAWRRCL